MIGSIGRTEMAAGVAAPATGGDGADADSGGSFAKVEETEAQPIDRLRDAIRVLGREAEMTPVKRSRRDVLEKLGLIEESLVDLPPERREHVGKQIAAEIERLLGTAGLDDRRPAVPPGGRAA